MSYLKLILLAVVMVLAGILLGATFDLIPVHDPDCKAIIAITGGVCP